MTLEKLKKFFEERPALNVKSIEQEAGVPQSLLGKILKNKKPLTVLTIQRLLPVLKKYGYK